MSNILSDWWKGSKIKKLGKPVIFTKVMFVVLSHSFNRDCPGKYYEVMECGLHLNCTI